MKPNIIKTLALAFLWLASAFTAQAKINVVATLPDFGAIAREIGGDKVEVTVHGEADRGSALRRCASEFRRQAAHRPTC